MLSLKKCIKNLNKESMSSLPLSRTKSRRRIPKRKMLLGFLKIWIMETDPWWDTSSSELSEFLTYLNILQLKPWENVISVTSSNFLRWFSSLKIVWESMKIRWRCWNGWIPRRKERKKRHLLQFLQQLWQKLTQKSWIPSWKLYFTWTKKSNLSKKS